VDSHFPFEILCAICDLPINLQTATTDDEGKTVHSDCYILLLKASTPERHRGNELDKTRFPPHLDPLARASL
jgi:hypothetical protein